MEFKLKINELKIFCFRDNFFLKINKNYKWKHTDNQVDTFLYDYVYLGHWLA